MQPDLGDQTDADLQMTYTLHPSLLSLALQRLLHGTGIGNGSIQELALIFNTGGNIQSVTLQQNKDKMLPFENENYLLP